MWQQRLLRESSIPNCNPAFDIPSANFNKVHVTLKFDKRELPTNDLQCMHRANKAPGRESPRLDRVLPCILHDCLDEKWSHRRILERSAGAIHASGHSTRTWRRRPFQPGGPFDHPAANPKRSIQDGAACYWQFIYDMTNSTFTKLRPAQMPWPHKT